MPSIRWMIGICTANVYDVDGEQKGLLVESVGGTQAINYDSTNLMLEMMEIGCMHMLQEFNILIPDVTEIVQLEGRSTLFISLIIYSKNRQHLELVKVMVNSMYIR